MPLRSEMLVKVITNPSIASVSDRYGRMRRMNQSPVMVLISHSRAVCRKNLLRIFNETAVDRARGKIGERPTHIALDDTKQGPSGGCEIADIEFEIEKQRRDIGAVEMFCRSFVVARCRSNVSCNWLFRALSSSLRTGVPPWMPAIPRSLPGIPR